jgi:predicted transglutaminase-like cysteine proteinase
VRTGFSIFLATFLTVFTITDARCDVRYSFETDRDYFAPASSWTAWQDTLDRHQFERDLIQECLRDESACTRRLKGLRTVLLKGSELRVDQQIRLVNRYINRQRYKEDRISWRSAAGNQWQTLVEFLSKGGDCEDFAVAKYFVLREFGFDAEDMRVVIGREPQRATHHAMLAIRLDGDVWLLENDNSIYRNSGQDIERFVYAINEQGIWDHEREN